MPRHPGSTLSRRSVAEISARLTHPDGIPPALPSRRARVRRWLTVYLLDIPTVLLVVWVLLAPLFLVLAFAVSLQMTVLWLKGAAVLFAWLMVASVPAMVSKQPLGGSLLAAGILLIAISLPAAAYAVIDLATATELSRIALGLMFASTSVEHFAAARHGPRRWRSLGYGVVGLLLCAGCVGLAVYSLRAPTRLTIYVPLGLLSAVYVLLSSHRRTSAPSSQAGS